MLVGSHERFDVRGLGKEEAREVEKRKGLATRAKLVLALTPPLAFLLFHLRQRGG